MHHTYLSSVAATGEHVLPLSVVKLGFVLRGHEFLVDADAAEAGHARSGESLLSVEDQEEARYDELKGTLAVLIFHVSTIHAHRCLFRSTCIRVFSRAGMFRNNVQPIADCRIDVVYVMVLCRTTVDKSSFDSSVGRAWH